jgi:POT family proton-dependent oligopeptide transporter
LLAVAGWSAHGGKVGLVWGLTFHLVNNLGVAMLFPLTLALFSRAAPAGLSGTMINASKLNFFVSFQLVGWLGGLVDKVDSGGFWAIHATVAGGAGVLLVVLGRLFRGILAPQGKIA